MKIKTILKLGIVLSLVILIVLSVWIFSISKTYEDTQRHAEIARKINNAVFQLSVLSNDYLLYFQKRASIQWKKAYFKLNEIFDDPEFEHLSEFINLKLLRKTHNRSLKLFERVEEARNKEIISNNALLQEQKKALSSQLLSTSQVISITATKIADITELKRKELEEQLFLVTVATFIIFIITLLGSWSLIATRIVLPVNRLKKYIDNFDMKYLNEKHNIDRNDEMGELINSFNELTEDLFNTVVSKEKLKEEVEERKKSENELIKQQNLNTSVLEGAGNIITILDYEGNFVQFNRAAEELTGYSRDELIGKPVWDFVIPKEQRDGVQKVFDALKQGDTTIAGNHENHWLTKKGEYRLIEWHNSVISDVSDEIIYIVAIGYDITEKRLNEVEKQRFQRELNQSRKMESLGQLTGGVAHDFNNMLAIILGYTDLALEYAVKNKESHFNKYLEQIQDASIKAKDLIAKMLAFSRTDQTSSYSIQISSLLDESLLLMKSILPSTIKLEISKEDNIPNILMGPVQFQQILMNLMINAKDAMDGVGTIRISLGLHTSINKECSSCHEQIVGDWVEIIISDNGLGMSNDVKERIFEPFFTTKEVGEGTGMGMSVVHGIVKGHKGHIIVDSTLGKGTSFHLLFPPLIDDIKPAADNIIEISESNHGNGERILIIDDQKALADVESTILSEHGYKCTKMYDSQKALELYLSDTNAFDLIVTDQTMPNLTGLDIINAIRNKNLTIPIIITTGYSDKIKEGNVEIENVTLLKKPVETKLLLKNISKYLEPS